MRSGESPDSIKLLEAILERGLRSRENKDGETPADLATKFGYKRMATALGKWLLLFIFNYKLLSNRHYFERIRVILSPSSYLN